VSNSVQSNSAVQKLNASFAYEEKDDPETGGSLTTVYLLFNGNKYKLGILHGSGDDVDKSDFADMKIPASAIAACGAWYAGSGSYFYIIQKGSKILLYQGYNGEEDPKISWQKVKEF
jgi:hypothetical protein